MIEQTIEQKFKAAVDAVCVTYSANVVGFWDTAAKGAIKRDEAPFIRVTIPPRSGSGQQSYNIKDTNMTIEIVSTIEDDPRKLKMIYWAGVVIDLISGLAGDATTLGSSAYSSALVYTINGLSEDGGEASWDSESKSWSVSIAATLHFCKA